MLLLHGLGANSYGYLYPGRSLAERLSRNGFDCYVAELRGAGQSGTRHWRYDLEDYLQWDVPAILSLIRETSGQQEVHWIGHSMGGVLLMCHGIREAEPHIGRGVCIGSALDYRVGGSGFERMLKARPLLERLSVVPFGAVTHLLSPLMGRFRNPVELFNFWPSNVEPGVVRAVHANAFGAIPVTLLNSLVGALAEEGLRSRDRSLRYLDHADRFPSPLLLLAGSQDRQCSVAAAEATARAIGSDRAQVAAFGKAFGHEDEYGHFDLLLGRRAPVEVWPRIERWLSAAGSVSAAEEAPGVSRCDPRACAGRPGRRGAPRASHE
ncbi:MAG: alpha/beta fold hydrolase [Myxococcales bacterium]|nr:alpha/beta fold hydrolase [Myxococcales bacterium]